MTVVTIVLWTSLFPYTYCPYCQDILLFLWTFLLSTLLYCSKCRYSFVTTVVQCVYCLGRTIASDLYK